MLRATLSPRPPPPYAALIATGRPCCSAKLMISLASATGSVVPGTSGALARVAMWRALTLSPSESIAAGDGPIQMRPASVTAWANSAFSERKPYPGWKASALVFAAMSSSFLWFR